MSARNARYEVERVLATGGMAEVLLARAVSGPHAGRHVVLKRMHPHLAESTDVRASFAREADLALRIHHPNVVQVLDVTVQDDVPVMVFEWLDGADLRTIARALGDRSTRMHPAQACAIASLVSRGLAHVHALEDDAGHPLGLVHRDVSPHNVFITRSGAVKLLDFGIAKIRAVATRSGLLRGKAAYMAPEQLAGLDLDARTDLFALGVVLWEMLTGRRLWAFADDADVARAIRDESAPPLRSRAPECSAELEILVASLLAKFAVQRPASAEAVAVALDALARAHGSRDAAVEIAGVVGRLDPPRP
jgi:serine/threonine-protein kinase